MDHRSLKAQCDRRKFSKCAYSGISNNNPNPNHNPHPNFQSIGPLVNRYFWSIIFGLLDLLSIESPRKWRLSASKKIKSACGHCSFTTPIFPPLTKVLIWNHCMRVFIIVIFSHRYPDSAWAQIRGGGGGDGGTFFQVGDTISNVPPPPHFWGRMNFGRYNVVFCLLFFLLFWPISLFFFFLLVRNVCDVGWVPLHILTCATFDANLRPCDSDSILLKTCVFFTVYWSIRMFIQLMQTSTLFSFRIEPSQW